MEYIDGEDLASLMKRIGHLSNEKALDIARQLVAGLTVAHERGVLHRDLKPANIMLDGHGRVRITDFGLAIAVGDESQAEEIAGTPAYMAPEQLAGKGATVRSDIYSLGLILYEIYTGKKAFKADTLAELRNQKEAQVPRAPSEIRVGIDPVVERVIQRCMEKDPNARPASVAQLAQALPGGDPLAAAIAAGETPSPEMVAASGSKEGLKPAVAWGLIALIVAGMLGIMWVNDRIMLHRRIPFEERPEALLERSKIFLENIGYSDNSAYSAYGYTPNDDLINYIKDSSKTADRWEKLDAMSILFWYRQSPRPLSPVTNIFGSTGPEDPPMQFSGEIMITLNSEGRLVSFRAIPELEQVSAETVQAIDWGIFFSEAGLDIEEWDTIDSQLSRLSYGDTGEVREGSLSNWPNLPARVELAALQGRPINFEVIGPWSLATRETPSQNPIYDLIAPTAFLILVLFGVVGGIFFARRNIRLGRGDRRSAKRLGFIIFGILILRWILFIPRVSIIQLLILPYIAGLIWVLYIAIEPYVRRRWPKLLISWTRLLSGDWKDPRVARDVFVGCAAGIVFNCILQFALYTFPLRQPSTISYVAVKGIRVFSIVFLGDLVYAAFISLVTVCVLFLLAILLRNEIAACTVVIILGALTFWTGSLLFVAVGLLIMVLSIIMLIRFGLLLFIAAYLIQPISKNYPITLDFSAWYSEYGFAVLLILAVIVLYAFRYSLGGRPIFGTPQLDD